MTVTQIFHIKSACQFFPQIMTCADLVQGGYKLSIINHLPNSHYHYCHYSFFFSYGGMNAVSNIITGIAGRLTTEDQVEEVSNILLWQTNGMVTIMQIL
jgi:hypothetical protein